jgi:phage gpG-like protein
MASVSWSQRLDPAAIRALVTSPRGGVVQDLLRRGLLVETQAKRNLGGVGGPKRVDTGRLRASINTQLVTRNGEPAVLVGTNVFYARWVHDGTGIYGPRARRITPKNHKRLRFRPSGSRKYVYARSVAGMRPNAFMKNALHAARG